MDIRVEIAKMVVAIITAILVSNGFWIFVERKRKRGDLSRQLLMGMAHDRMIFLSMKYIERGFVTQDEHENLCKHLYEPYIAMGGNGSAIRLMKEVDKLRILNQPIGIQEKLKGEHTHDHQQ